MSKILLISSKDYNFYNFRSKFILELKNLGHEVILVCPYGEKIDYFTEKGCRFIGINIDRTGTSVLKDLKLIKGYKKILKQERPDLVLLYTTKCSVYAGLLCGKLKIPYIVNNAGLIDTSNRKVVSKILNFLYKIGFKKASCMMYQNSNERDVLQKVLKNKTHFRELPGSGVDLDEFSFKPYIEREEIIFNFVGRIVKLKGIENFLECAKIIKNKYPITKFIIYGEFVEEEYKSKIAELNKENIVEYGGVLMDMKPAIVNCSAVIHASFYEGMTNVVLEHSAMGRPCIGTDVFGVKEGIEDGVTGYIFKVNDTEDLVNKVEKFISLSYEEKKEMGRQARIKMENEFDREMVTKIYFEEIEKILGKNFCNNAIVQK